MRRITLTQWSDVDLAAWGLTAANGLKASAAVRALDSDSELNVLERLARALGKQLVVRFA